MKDNTLNQRKNRDNEKGAAMVMVLLISFLLLVASAGILLETSLNTANVTDATAEQQAYNAAESGIQSAVNVLRGNTVPNPLINSNPSPTPSDNEINYVKALSLQTSNKPGEASSVPRLSRWLNYNYTSPGSPYPDRVLLGKDATNYNPQRDSAFSLTISDPDNTGTVISYTTEGTFYDSNPLTPEQITFDTTSANFATIIYEPANSGGTVTKDISSGSAITDFGKFRVTAVGSPYVPAYSRFEITVRITQPHEATFSIRGYITTGTISSSTGPTIAKLLYDSQTYTRIGSVSKLSGGQTSDYTAVYGKDSSGKDISKRFVGYEVPMKIGENTVNASITAPEPTRLLITSTGYGPRGAVKRLEAIIQKDYFDGLSAPATLTLIGPPSTTNPTTSFLFEPGSSNVTEYSGVDVSSTDIIPPIGTTNPDNLFDVEASVDGKPPHPYNGKLLGTPSDILYESPDWLKSPYNLDKAVTALYQVAVSSGRYFGAGKSPADGNFGSFVTAQGITFVDGNCDLSGDGGGILVVTGTLTLKGAFNFKGMIIVTGQGGVERQGGGNGTLRGNMVIAPYRNSRMTDNKTLITETVDFLSPRYNLDGGGNSTITYDSSSVANSLVAVSNFVLGVAEK